jgi:hypothetical protein
MKPQPAEENYLEQLRVSRDAWEEDRRIMSVPIGDLKALVSFLNYCRSRHEGAANDTAVHVSYDPGIKTLFSDGYNVAARETLAISRYTEAIELVNSLMIGGA